MVYPCGVRGVCVCVPNDPNLILLRIVSVTSLLYYSSQNFVSVSVSVPVRIYDVSHRRYNSVLRRTRILS